MTPCGHSVCAQRTDSRPDWCAACELEEARTELAEARERLAECVREVDHWLAVIRDLEANHGS